MNGEEATIGSKPTVIRGVAYLFCNLPKEATDQGVQQFETGNVMQKRVLGSFAESSSNSSSNSIGPAG